MKNIKLYEYFKYDDNRASITITIKQKDIISHSINIETTNDINQEETILKDLGDSIQSLYKYSDITIEYDI